MGFAEHLERFYPDNEHAVIAPTRLEVEDRLPGFRVWRIAPAQPGKPWVYATCGAAQSAPDGEKGAEYVLLAPGDDPAIAEMLGALATVNADAPHGGLGVGSIIALGRSWIAKSWARWLLVLPPYAFDPQFAIFEQDGRSTVVLWLVPILAAEAQYVRDHGHEALVQIIETRKANVADPARASVV